MRKIFKIENQKLTNQKTTLEKKMCFTLREFLLITMSHNVEMDLALDLEESVMNVVNLEMEYLKNFVVQ